MNAENLSRAIEVAIAELLNEDDGDCARRVAGMLEMRLRIERDADADADAAAFDRAEADFEAGREQHADVVRSDHAVRRDTVSAFIDASNAVAGGGLNGYLMLLESVERHLLEDHGIDLAEASRLIDERYRSKLGGPG